MAMDKEKTTKKSFRAQILELQEILRISVRMWNYGFKNAKSNTIGFFVTVLLVSFIPYGLNKLWTLSLDALILAGDNKSYVLAIFILYVVGIAIEKILWVLTDYFERSNYYMIHRSMSYDMSKKLAELDIQYYENPKFNNLLQKVSESYGWRANDFLNRIFWVIRDVVGLIIAVAIMVSFSPLAVLIIVIISIPEVLNKLKYGRQGWAIWDLEGESRRNYYDTLSLLNRENSLFEIKIYNTKQYLLNIIKTVYDGFISKQEKAEKKGIITSGIISLIIPIGYGIIGYMLINSFITGGISVGSFAFYMATVLQFSSSFSNFLRNVTTNVEHGLYVIDIFKVLDLEKFIVNGSKTLEYKEIPPKIEFQGVSFKYPSSDKYVFKDLDFTINPGENIALVGKNGAGKTTLVKLLCRFYDVTEGKILVDGIDIKELDIDSLYKKISLLTQDFVRYHFDAKTNIGLGDIDNMDDYQRVEEAARKGGAHDFISNDFTKKYDQVLSKRYNEGTEPSVGQWQKIALSRAFFKNAPIIILDEPTSAIDPKAEAQIFDNIFRGEKTNQDKTIITVSHRFSTVRNADKIIVMENGKIAEQGTHKELMQLNGIYKEAFELQKRGYE